MLRDRVFDNPGSVVIMCLIWAPIGFWVLALVQWLIQGEIDILLAICGIFIGIGLGITAMLAKDPTVAPMIFASVVLTMIAFPVVRNVLNTRALKAIDADAIERAYQVLLEKPTNAAGRFKLARHVYAAGMVGHAIAIGEEALKSLPEAMFGEEHKILQGWKRSSPPAETVSALQCVDCGHPNAPGLLHCEKCGAPFLLDHARGRWVGRATARKIIAGWCAMVVAIVGIPYAARALPPTGAIAIVVGLVVVAVALLVISFRGEERQAAK